MANSFIKAERVVRTALGLLEREVTLPRLVWRDAVGDFRGAKKDAITVRLPAYANAHTRALRSGASRVQSELVERSVDLHLTKDVYMDVPISDEQLTLDIEDFGAQVLNPVNAAVARAVEDELAATIAGAPYHTVVSTPPDGILAATVEARKALNLAQVPAGGRTLLVGAGWEAALLTNENLTKASQAGDASALRDATVGRLYGVEVVVSNLIQPDTAYLFHRTAFVLSSRAPVVPTGAPWGASAAFGGFALRNVRSLDVNKMEDRFLADVFIGSQHVPDQGSFDEHGRFTPSEVPDTDREDEVFVRAVKLVLEDPPEPEEPSGGGGGGES
jgi:hypothetical protein